jgi:hypothetical protein
VPALRLPYPPIVTDQRKALHDQVEQTLEEDIDCLVDFINRFLHPLESPESQRIVFEPVPPGSKAAAEIEEQRQQALAQLNVEQLDRISGLIGDTVIRLGIDLNKIGEGFRRSSSAGGMSPNFTCSWFEGRLFNRLSMFYLKEQQVVTFERCHISETQPELIYKVRVLTPIADIEKKLTVPI